jgi:hypothetical protein
MDFSDDECIALNNLHKPQTLHHSIQRIPRAKCQK